MSETRWFAKRDGVERGPFSAAQLRELAADGRLRPSDLVRRGDSPKWVAAATLRGLFPAAPRPSPAAAFVPPAPASLGRPPAAPPVLGAVAALPPSLPKPLIDAPGSVPSLPAATHDGGVGTGVMTGLMWATLATGGLSILLEPWRVVVDDRPFRLFLAAIPVILELTALVLESILLFCAWFALPARFRFRGLNPWLAAGLSFVPLFGLGWYFVSYGMLADGWRRVAAGQEPRDDEAVGLLSWVGWACAGIMLAMWLLCYLECIASVSGTDFMSWYTVPLLEGAEVRPHGRRNITALLKFLSLQCLCRALLLYLLSMLYGTIIRRARAEVPA